MAQRVAGARDDVKADVGLLTGGIDRPYAFGLAKALLRKGLGVDFIGSDDLESPELCGRPRLNFLNLRGDQREDVSLLRKTARVLTYYGRLVRYAAQAEPRILHVLWNNKWEVFDRTLLMLYYRARGKKIVLTAHNVNAARRDMSDSLINRLSLKSQYWLAHHIFVHTDRMKREIVEDFGVCESSVTVIPLGMNESVPVTDLTGGQARRRLGIGEGDRTILFFGRIGPYKGLEILVPAFERVAAGNPAYRLIIAGKPKEGCETYVAKVEEAIARSPNRERVTRRIEFIPDEETEMYFKAADVLVLPYRDASQSGVLVLGYSFGVPAIATDVGAFALDVVEGRTGFLCRAGDPVALGDTIEAYFRSELFNALPRRRQEIRTYARARYSWDTVSETTVAVYQRMLSGRVLGRGRP
jgi:glycosyltransferase involved in cell wall biosynthesis